MYIDTYRRYEANSVYDIGRGKLENILFGITLNGKLFVNGMVCTKLLNFITRRQE